MAEQRISEAASRDQSLERIAKILAMMAVKDFPQAEQILLLRGFGYTPAEIAELLNTSPNNVSVIIYRSKKQQKRKRD